MDNQKVLFTCPGKLQYTRRGIYKNLADDIISYNLTVDKNAEEQQLIFGFANVSVQEDGTPPKDWQGDIIKTVELENAAYNYVLHSGIANQEHVANTDCGILIESMMFTKEKCAALGIPDGILPEAWWVGFYIPDKSVYQKVKDGTYNMFSIEGTSLRIPL